MHARKEHFVPAKRFPSEWESQVADLLNSTYESKVKIQEGFFEVFAMTYPDEILLAVSLKSTVPSTWPLTLKVSADLNEKTNSKKLMDILLNSVGLFIDHILNEEKEYFLDWEEASFENVPIWYMSTREDMALSLEADKLLQENHSSL
ncbi:MAG: hypothetical protein ACO20H_06460 [Bacteriovoracaceae bacterium]